jgi:hypothetical protein
MQRARQAARTCSTAGADTKEANAWLNAQELKLPKLSPVDLVAKALSYYDKQFAPGQTKALEIIVAFLHDIPPGEENAAFSRRERWLAGLALAYLRAEITKVNPVIARLAAETKSRAVKRKIMARISDAIAREYPGLERIK